MRAIVTIKSTPSSPTALMRHCLKPHGRDADEISCEDRVSAIGGRIEGGITRDARVDIESLISRHHGRGKRVKHVVISCQDSEGEARAEALAALPGLANDWIKSYAPTSDYIYLVHQDRQHPHMHVLLCNSDGKKCLDWSPQQLRRMQDFKWTVRATSGRGSGKHHEPGRGVYPLARNLRATELLKLTKEQINERIKSGSITVGRRNSSGVITSVIIDGRRIRLSTLERLRGGGAKEKAEERQEQSTGTVLLPGRPVSSRTTSSKSTARDKGSDLAESGRRLPSDISEGPDAGAALGPVPRRADQRAPRDDGQGDPRVR